MAVLSASTSDPGLVEHTRACGPEDLPYHCLGGVGGRGLSLVEEASWLHWGRKCSLDVSRHKGQLLLLGLLLVALL